MVCNHLKLRLRSFLFLIYANAIFKRMRLLWQMNSHNSAISSRTDFPSVASRTVTIHRCFHWAVVLYPLTHSSNASLLYPCMIIYNRPGVAFSQSPIIYAVCINGFTCRISAAFPCSLHGCYVCLLKFY